MDGDRAINLAALATLRNRAIQRGGQLLQRVGLALSAIETPRGFAGVSLQWRRDPPTINRGAVVEAAPDGHPLRFFVGDDHDLIQRYHLRGKFYEPEELEIMAPHARGMVADIGANVGNHTLYLLTRTETERVIAFEPNPPALRVLELNLLINGLSDRVEIHRVGLSDAPGTARALAPYANLSGTWLVPGGDLQLVTGDSVLADQPVSLLKIDVEKMEMPVLAGLRETISRHRPAIFIEIDKVNADAFHAWRAAAGYRVEATHSRYSWSDNHLILPE